MLSPLAQALFAWILGVVILVGCCAYVVVVVVVCRDKEFRRSAASIFLLNLLTIDLLNLLLVMPFSINSINGRWYIAHVSATSRGGGLFPEIQLFFHRSCILRSLHFTIFVQNFVLFFHVNFLKTPVCTFYDPPF